MADLARKAVFAAVALPALLRAALRLAWLDRRHDLEELAERMARVPPWRCAWLANPRYLEACVRRLSGWPPGWLPGRRFGPCLERSLLLLDLWSRCRLRPRIHLGAARTSDGGHGFHAWVSLPDEPAPEPASEPGPEPGPEPAGGPRYAEIWSYPASVRRPPRAARRRHPPATSGAPAPADC